MLDSWKKLMLPFNQHGKLGRKMFHIVATQHSKRNFFSLYDVIAHCTFGKYLAFVINALVLSKDSLVCMFHCNLYFWPSFLLFIYLFFCSYNPSVTNQANSATSAENANGIIPGWMLWFLKSHLKFIITLTFIKKNIWLVMLTYLSLL